MSGAPNIVGNQARPATPSVPGVAGAPPANLGAAVQSLMPAAKPGFAGTPWVGGQTDSSMTEGGGNWGQPLTNGSGQNPGGGEESNMSYIQAPQGWTPPWMQSAPTQPSQPGTKSGIQPIMGGKMADGGGVGGLPVRKTIMPIGASGVDAGEIGTPWERMFPPTVKR
jgi:hypothetical protein